MSRIFDALQRSETERRGADSDAPAATELLERAEREAAAQWDSSGAHTTAEGAETAALGSIFGSTCGTGIDAAVDRAPDAESIFTENPSAAFPHFRPHEISVSVQGKLVSLVATETPAAEAFRLLAVRLRHRRAERNLKKLLVTGSTPEEGKSMVAANLACTLAHGTPQRILLLDGDLRRPSVNRLFGLGAIPGICDCLRGEQRVQGCIYRLERAGIWVLPAGKTSATPLELMQSNKFSLLMGQLAAWFDWIVIDSPPVVPLADTSIWVRHADGVLLVARTGITRKGLLQKALEAIDQSKFVGALLNSSTSSRDQDYYHYRHPSATSPDSSPLHE
jgi:capsular exopolysaccharide synthesis family protein